MQHEIPDELNRLNQNKEGNMKGMSKNRSWAIVVIVFCLVSVLSAGTKNMMRYRLLWEQGNIQKYPDFFKGLIDRASKAGYNTMVFVDYALNSIEKQNQAFHAKYKDVQAYAKQRNIQLAPWTLWQGFPAYENQNLGESFPVKETKFTVSGKEARAVGDHDTGLKNGGFEAGTGNWGLRNLSGATAIDNASRKAGSASLRIKNAPGYSYISQKLTLKPYRAYEVSAWFKTSKINSYSAIRFDVDPNLLCIKERSFGTPKIWTTLSGTQGWRKSVSDFNSLYYRNATLYIRLAAGAPQGGTIWIDEVKVREVGLYETMRGPSRPIVVKNATGTTTYKEGTDYVVDPKCNTMTGDTYWYEGHLKIPAGSAIKDKQELRVSWHQFANVKTYIAASDFCLEKTWTTLEDNIQKIDNLFGGSADAVYMKYSEYRMGGWSQNCKSFHFTNGGQYMAKTLEISECLLRKNGNGCRTIFSENDMYDPYFNGYNGPYGTWVGDGTRLGGTYGAYKGLSPDIVIFNWNTPFGPAYTDSSLLFFAGKDPKYPREGNKQIVNCLDGGGANGWCNAIDRLEPRGLEGVEGFLYTDWYYSKYTHIEQVAQVFKARGRWSSNPFPGKTCAPIKDECGVSIADRAAKAPTSRQILSMKAYASHDGITVQYAVPEYQNVTIKVFDLMGREVRTLVNRKQEIGTHQVNWSTANLPAGMYLLRLAVDGVGQQTIKQIVF